MKTIIGQVATGENYFPRSSKTDQIWNKLDSGSHLLLVAPRRVGKSSILFNLLDNPKPGYIVVYYTSESVNSINEFYKKLFNKIIEKVSGVQKYKKKVAGIAKDLLSRIESISVLEGGLKIGESKIHYLELLNDLLADIDLGTDRLVVLIDEFSVTVENIIEDSDKRTAINFLQTKREIRQAPQLSKKIQFIYAGSIGLENVVGLLDSTSLIGDLCPVTIEPLTKQEAEELTKKIIDNSPYSFENDVYDYFLENIEWYIPFFFQVLLDEINSILVEKDKKIISKDLIDIAVTKALKKGNLFDHWLERLRKAYKGKEFTFVKELLNAMSGKIFFQSTEIHDLAVGYKLEKTYKDLLKVLKYDGYINNDNDPQIYRFNSKLLKEWWYRNVAN
jgi:hypothetical protein